MSVKTKTKQFFLNFLKASIYFCAIMAISLEAPYMHKSYLRGIAQSSVVRVVGKNGIGTGFHVKASNGKTYLLTNKHVCQMTGPLKAEKYGARLGIERKIIKISDKHDLCVLEALPEVKGLSVSGSAAEDGEAVYTLGHPRGDALSVASGEKI